MRIWPRGLVSQVIVVLAVAVALEYAGSAILFERWLVTGRDTVRVDGVIDRLEEAREALERQPIDQRAALAQAMSSPDLTISWNLLPVLPAPLGLQPQLSSLRTRILTQEPSLAAHDLRLQAGEHDETGADLVGSLALADGSQMVFVAPSLLRALPLVLSWLVSAAIFAAAIGVAAILVIRTLTAPLRALGQAAAAIGNLPSVPVNVNGPREVRDVARAMSAMQERIARLVADRTQALAAVSHDLRTPIARMRLQADFLTDDGARATIVASLDEMEAMVASVLAYLSGEVDSEAPRKVDLAVMLISLANDARDAGHIVTCQGPDHQAALVRPLAMKRAFANLIGNAVTYGGPTTLKLDRLTDTLRIRVEDRGPGIPETDLARVLHPFQRSDTAREGSPGGAGLGLAIVLQAVQREGGTLSLSNRPEGGLRAEVLLPLG